MKIDWRIKRYRQPYHALAGVLEQLCALTGHINACALLNRHGHPFSAPYQWLENRAIVWEPLDQTQTSGSFDA